jgi:hypothetical protein
MADENSIIYADTDLIDAHGRRIGGKAAPEFDKSEAFCRIWGWSFLNGGAMLLPRKVLLEAGGFREDMPTTQDYDLWLRLTRIASFHRLPQVLLLSRQHDNQGSKARAHQKECVVLLSAYVPQLLDNARSCRGGFTAAAPLLARAVLQRAADYGFVSITSLWVAFGQHATLRERCILAFPLLLRLPHACLRRLWLQLPQSLRTQARTNCLELKALWGKFCVTFQHSGKRIALKKVLRYVRRVAGRVRRVLMAAPVQPGCLPPRAQQSLYVVLDHDAGGGVYAFREHFVKRLLAEGKAVLIWQYLGGVGQYLFEWRCGKERQLFRTRRREKAVSFVLSAAPQSVFLNSVVGWPNMASTLEAIVSLGQKGARLEVFLHDYFALCPAYPLLDRKGTFCGIPMPPYPCGHCLPGHPLAAPHDALNVETWRTMWGRFLLQADSIAVADESVRELFARVYPFLADRVNVTPPEPLRHWPPLPQRVSRQAAVIGVIGNIARHKGAGIVEGLVHLLAEQKQALPVVVIGELESSLRHPLLRVTGAYEHTRLPELLEHYGVSLCLVPSPLPETFCYVAQEVEMLGLPLICLDLGAQGARARRYARGFVAPTPDASGCFSAILQARGERRQQAFSQKELQ